MADNLTSKERSYCMSQIKSKWTKPEQKIHNWLKGNKIKHKMHPDIPGRPDLILKDTNTVVFVHGCFWHKCPKCYKEPKTNKEYWLPKIKKNVLRDKKNKIILKSKGYNVITLWGHDIKQNFDLIINKLGGVI